MKVKKTLMDMIIKWHQAGYSLDEIAPLMPQVPKEEIKAIIQHTRKYQTRHNQHKPTKTSQRSPACAKCAAGSAICAIRCVTSAMP